jgi:hypothetical protein
MNFEQMQTTMQFLLEQQAKHDVIISQHSDRMKELQQMTSAIKQLVEKNDKRTDLLLQLAQNYDERADISDQRLGKLEDNLRLGFENFQVHLQAHGEDLLAHLSKHDVSISQHSEQMNELRRSFQALTEIARKYDERLELTDQRVRSLEKMRNPQLPESG